MELVRPMGCGPIKELAIVTGRAKPGDRLRATAEAAARRKRNICCRPRRSGSKARHDTRMRPEPATGGSRNDTPEAKDRNTTRPEPRMQTTIPESRFKTGEPTFKYVSPHFEPRQRYGRRGAAATAKPPGDDQPNRCTNTLFASRFGGKG